MGRRIRYVKTIASCAGVVGGFPQMFFFSASGLIFYY
jgi:hypothetical protein